MEEFTAFAKDKVVEVMGMVKDYYQNKEIPTIE